MKWKNAAVIALVGISVGFGVVFSLFSGTGEVAAAEEKTEASSPTPLHTLQIYLDAFHFHNGDFHRQMEVHHFCGGLESGVIQCALFDGKEPGARLIGIEYVIGEAVFASLPVEEKKLWHSHVYEVKSGQLTSPNLSLSGELDLMKQIASTYGKTWHTWHTDHLDGKLPLGVPSLMMGFTADGQADPALVEKRDRKFGISTEAKKRERTDLPSPPVLPGANGWQTGDAFQLKLKKVPMKTGKP
jgi:hypothetical protein